MKPVVNGLPAGAGSAFDMSACCPVDACAGIDVAPHVQWFRRYAAFYLQLCSADKEPLQLKIDHTMRVFDNARRILDDASSWEHTVFSEQRVIHRSALLAALYHDTGRFPQYIAYGTFNDRTSVNHGFLGCRTLRQLNVLGAEPARVSRNALAAIVMHNRMALPAGICAELRFVTEVVREADKLDIMSVIAEYLQPDGPRNDVVTLHLADEPEKWTAGIAESVLSGGAVRYEDMRYLNDFILLLCNWVFGLHFTASCKMVRRQGVMEKLVHQLPADKSGTLGLVRDKVLIAVAAA
ncbi:HD domain-containing protein [Oleidesulfovibrio sp.]|uniref:HD domain-containing protein n=1 Tax=Oleidesulfovibrio sp. TaxID=2909707 RepID=UPI003A8C0CD3